LNLPAESFDCLQGKAGNVFCNRFNLLLVFVKHFLQKECINNFLPFYGSHWYIFIVFITD